MTAADPPSDIARYYTPLPGKIILEEALRLPSFDELNPTHPWQQSARYKPIMEGLLDVDGRIEDMDRYGIGLQVLSLSAPGLQGVPDAKVAQRHMVETNDQLAEIVARHPDRFAGFAGLAMHDADAAASELRRCVEQLGFVGALINGCQNVGDEKTVAYLDEPQYWPFWREVEALGVPVYIHARDPVEGQQRILDGHPEMHASVWAYTPETAGHALRLIMSGLFDDFPNLQIILGHLGEGLSFSISRIDRRLFYVEEQMKRKLAHPPSHYLRNNFYLTTAGAFDTLAMQNAVAFMGIARILFSIDYPFETLGAAVDWFETAPLTPEDRRRIAIENAAQLLRTTRST